MENKIHFEQLFELLEQKKLRELRKIFDTMNEVDIALFIEELETETAAVVFRTLGKSIAAEVFANLNPDLQEDIINKITDSEVAFLIDELYLDDAVDMLEQMPANVVKRILGNAKSETRALINQFLNYPENSAGSIMTAEYVYLNKEMTVEQAFRRIRATAIDKETVYTCYVISAGRVLEGVITVRALLLAKDDAVLADIMEKDIISANVLDDREVVAQLFSKYDFLTIPVVDADARLVGIVTVDDAVDVLQEEATEDFEKMAAITPSEKPYLKTSVFKLAKNRIFWLFLLMVSGMFTGIILAKYENAFAVMPILVTFIPMLTDTGGNAGAQSSTLIIRGMALNEIETGDFFRVLLKEFGVAVLVGVLLSVANFLRIVIFYPHQSAVALVAALALFATVVIAKTVGGMLPMLAKLIKADPAIMAAPLITTVVDAFCLIIYFQIAQKVLHI